VDDHPVMRAGILYILQASEDINVCGEAGTQILAAIRNVMAGDIYLNRRLSTRFINTAMRGRNKTDRTAIEGLSDRELHVFQLIGVGLKPREIAKDLGLGIKTVETYHRNLRIKLELTDNVALRRGSERWVETGAL
jgi:DNA-binding NarL/FixJ family response regulator